MPWFTCQTLWPLCYLTQKACALSAQETTPDHWTTKYLSISLISSSYVFCLASSARLLVHDSFVFHQLTSSLLVNVPSSIITITLKQFTQHASSIAFKSALKTHLFCSGLGIPCLCVCARARTGLCWKWWEGRWMKCCSVLVYIISRISLCSCFCVYFVNPIVFVLCTLGSC